MASVSGGSFRSGRNPTFRSPTDPNDPQPTVGLPPAAAPNPGALRRGGRGFNAASFGSAGDVGYRPGEEPPPAPEEDLEALVPVTPLGRVTAGSDFGGAGESASQSGERGFGPNATPAAPGKTGFDIAKDVVSFAMNPMGFTLSEMAKAEANTPGTLASKAREEAELAFNDPLGYLSGDYAGVTTTGRQSSAKGGERGYGDDTRGMPGNPGNPTGTPSSVEAPGDKGVGNDGGTPGGTPSGGFGAAPGTDTSTGEHGGGVGGDTGVGNDQGNGGGGGDTGGGSDGGMGSCFVSGTSILMADGSEKAIDEISVGDRVMCFPEGEAVCASAPLVEGTVTDVMPPAERDDVISINGVGVSPNHRFVTRDGDFTEAEYANLGTTLVAGNGDHVLVTRRGMVGKAMVHNFTVVPHHTYVAAGYRVHNEKREGGYTGDDGDSRLEPRRITAHEREFVQRPEAVSKYGRAFMEALNRGDIDPAAAKALVPKGGRVLGGDQRKPGKPMSAMPARPVSRLGKVQAKPAPK